MFPSQGEILNEWQADNNQSINNDDAVDHKQQIANIEYLLAVTDPRLFTVESVNNVINVISETIIWVRSNVDKVAYDTQQLNKNLYDARASLIVAIEERNKNKTARYCKYLREGYEHLQAALTAWETSG